MKKFIFTMIVSVFACMSISAEGMTDNNTANEVPSTQVEAQPVDNGLLLQYPNLYDKANYISSTEIVSSTESKAANFDDQGYRNVQKWKNGRTLRTVGMVATGLGVATFVAGLATMNENSDNDAGKALAKIFVGPRYVFMGAVVAAAGGIMWAVGNHKMRKARLSYTGNGLAYNF